MTRKHPEQFTNDPAYEAFEKIVKATYLDQIKFRTNTAMPAHEQFWEWFDQIYELSLKEMQAALPLFTTTTGTEYKFEAASKTNLE